MLHYSSRSHIWGMLLVGMLFVVSCNNSRSPVDEERGGQALENPFDLNIYDQSGPIDEFLRGESAEITVDIDEGDLVEPEYESMDLRINGNVVKSLPANEAPVSASFGIVDFGAHDSTERPVLVEVLVNYDPELEEPPSRSAKTFFVDSRVERLSGIKTNAEVIKSIDWDGSTPSLLVLRHPAEGQNSFDKAMSFIGGYPQLFRIDDPEQELVPHETRTSAKGALTHVEFMQHWRGLPVVGSSIVVTIAQDEIVSVTANYDEDLDEIAESIESFLDSPEVDQPAAEKVAQNHVVSDLSLFRPVVIGDTRPVIRMFENNDGERMTSKVAWRVTVQAVGVDGSVGHRTVYIDASNGDVLVSTTYSKDALSYGSNLTNDMQGNEVPELRYACYIGGYPGTQVCAGSTGDPSTDCSAQADLDANNFVSHTKVYSDFLEDYLDRGSPQGVVRYNTSGDGSPIPTYVGLVNTDLSSRGPNVVANYMQYCDLTRYVDFDANGGSGMSLEIAAHEITHSLTTWENDFECLGAPTNVAVGRSTQWQPCALHEHYSYVFAEIAETYADPNYAFSPFNGSVNHIEDTYGEWEEHFLARLMNAVWGTAVSGNTFNGVQIPAPLSEEQAARIMLGALKNLSPTSDFEDYRRAILAQAEDFALVGAHGLLDENVCSLRNAFGAVGYRADLIDQDCDGVPDPGIPDEDNDGIANGADNCPEKSNANQRDLDGDGVGNVCDDDIDGDGMGNWISDPTKGADPCPFHPPIEDSDNPNISLSPTSTHRDRNNDGQPDACTDVDGDTYIEGEDNCPYDWNEFQRNADADDWGNSCDPNDDNDNYLDSNDNCRLVPNNSQSDVDGDLVGDACDDGDDDGVLDTTDNCPNAANPDQMNSDSTFAGDVCDNDDDGDGVDDLSDNCQKEYNPSQINSDTDIYGDACDNCDNTANDQSDANNDTKGDACSKDDDGDLKLDDYDDGGDHGNTPPDRSNVCSSGNEVGCYDPCSYANPFDTTCDDNCPHTYNPLQKDEDGDGIGDKCDDEGGNLDPNRWENMGQWTDARFRMTPQEDFVRKPVNLNKVSVEPCEPEYCDDAPMLPEDFHRIVTIEGEQQFTVALVNGFGRPILVRHAEPDGEGGWVAKVRWEPAQGSYFKSEYASTGVVRTETYGLRVSPGSDVEEAVELSPFQFQHSMD